MKGKLKNGEFRIGRGNPFGGVNLPRGGVVTITAKEYHPVFGERYKILGYNEWFEKNCFEYVEETEGRLSGD